jgi:pimeloyl-ACP methyl ester carboxylesterase
MIEMRRFLVALVTAFVIAGGAAAEDVTLEHDGLTLNGNLEIVDGWGSSMVLLVHGMLAHKDMEIIATLQELLAERGLGSLTINLGLGLDDRHGMYDCTAPHTHLMTDAVDETGAWLDWLAGRGVSAVVLTGHSNGGRQVAWFAAERGHDLIERVVLVAPGLSSAESRAAGYDNRYGAALAPLLAEAKALVAAGHGDTMMAHTDFLYCPDTTVSAASFVSYYGDDPRLDTRHHLPAITKPVLVVAGSDDQVVQGLPEAMAPFAASGAIDYVEIEDADHFFLDFFAEDLADAMTAFMADGGS